MKIKYRVLESRYSDGSVRFFPQSGDWWHGWRFYGINTWSDFDNWGNRVHVCFDTLEHAEAYLKRQIEWRKTHDPKKVDPMRGYVHKVKEVIHNYSEDN